MTDTTQLAFPGAVGYGRFTQGGRGGKVFHVTTLEDATPAPPGSLRAAIIAKGPRIVVFDVAGTIDCVAQMSITEPYITIAGQTAPGEGICLKNGLTNMDSPIGLRGPHILISDIKSRPGPGGTSREPGKRHGDAVDAFGNKGSSADVHHVYLRNCSASWSVDELIDYYGIHDSTIDGCLLAEPLNLSTHSYTAENPQIGHAKTVLFSHPGCANNTLYRCVMAHAMDRMPEMRLESGVLDFINNVIYNWGPLEGDVGGRQWVGHLNNLYGDWAINFIGNLYKPGPNSANRLRIDYDYPADPADTAGPETPLGSTLTAYEWGNIDTAEGLVTITQTDTERTTLIAAAAPLGEVGYGNPLPAWAAYDLLVKEARCGDWYRLNDMGARVARSDAVDRRILQEIVEGSGKIINHPDEVGGWPTLDPGQPLDWNDNHVPRAFAEHHPDSTIDDFLWR
jgi:pectate lyase